MMSKALAKILFFGVVAASVATNTCVDKDCDGCLRPKRKGGFKCLNKRKFKKPSGEAKCLKKPGSIFCGPTAPPTPEPTAECPGSCYDNRCTWDASTQTQSLPDCVNPTGANCDPFPFPTPLDPTGTIKFVSITEDGTTYYNPTETSTDACDPATAVDLGFGPGIVPTFPDPNQLFTSFTPPLSAPVSACVKDPFFELGFGPPLYWIFSPNGEGPGVLSYKYWLDDQCTIPLITKAFDGDDCVQATDCTFEPKCFCLSYLFSKFPTGP